MDIRSERKLRGNPDPSPATRFQPIGDEPLARTARGAKFPVSVDRVLAEMAGERSEFIRAAVIEKLEREGLL